jgi:hypothetical protein
VAFALTGRDRFGKFGTGFQHEKSNLLFLWSLSIPGDDR